MGLLESITLAVVDKLLIGLLILIFGFWLNSRLEKLKGQIALQNSIAPNRSAAYARLWTITEPLSPQAPISISPVMYKDLYEILRHWYYEEGNAMYLSLDASDFFLKSLTAINSDRADPIYVKNIYSKLRTQMKVDIGAYTSAEALVQIPKAR